MGRHQMIRLDATTPAGHPQGAVSKVAPGFASDRADNDATNPAKSLS